MKFGNVFLHSLGFLTCYRITIDAGTDGGENRLI